MGQYKAQFISMIIMIALGIGVFLGFNMEWYSIEKNTVKFYKDSGFADYRLVNEAGFSAVDLDKIENIDTLTIPLTQNGHTQDYMRYKITFKDRPNEANFYRIIVDKQMRLWGYNHEEGGEDYLHWTKHISYSFIGREDIVLTDGQPSTGDDEDNGLFDTAKNIYGVFDDSRFRLSLIHI